MDFWLKTKSQIDAGLGNHEIPDCFKVPTCAIIKNLSVPSLSSHFYDAIRFITSEALGIGALAGTLMIKLDKSNRIGAVIETR